MHPEAAERVHTFWLKVTTGPAPEPAPEAGATTMAALPSRPPLSRRDHRRHGRRLDLVAFPESTPPDCYAVANLPNSQFLPGAAANSALVYSSLGEPKTCSAEPYSTTRPLLITAT